jgi:hypothetical protein
MTKLSFQLYSARNFQPYSAIFEKLGKAGYQEVEGFGGIYADLDDAGLNSLRADLDKNGLVMATGHFSPDFLDGEVEKSLNIAKILGMDAIYAPHLAADERPTDGAGWLAFGKRLQEMSKPYKDAGYEFGWHNHDFEFVKLADGSLPIERIFEGAPRHFLGSRYRLGRSRRCRSARLDREARLADHRRPRQGHRTAGENKDEGRLGRCRPRHARWSKLMPRSRAPRPSISSSSMTIRPISTA